MRVLGLFLLALAVPLAAAAPVLSVEQFRALLDTPEPPILVDMRLPAEQQELVLSGVLVPSPGTQLAGTGGGRVVLIHSPAQAPGAALLEVWQKQGFAVLLFSGLPAQLRALGLAATDAPAVTAPAAPRDEIRFVIPRGICETLPPVREESRAR